ncbi:MAG: IS110 family transposase [Clostridium sp.]|uniref:Transposase IS116/IS110/IS902 family protein n=1 Tax=Clostridium tertium TaxID=1559 RepID=A0A6N3F334_9CLOT|nr:IS110 family transposase [Clostridium sp.]MDU3546398.1 IS110 family transposase [Clostridium sp.]
MVDNKELFIGIDIGKEINWVSFLLEGKKEEIRKRVKINNDIYGFYKLLEILEDYKSKEGIKEENIIIGIESTGHYWQNLYNFFNKRNYDVVMVKNRIVKLKREAKYSQKGKNDSIDCHCIGLVLKDDDYFEIKERDKNYASLKRLTRCKEDYTKSNIQNKNRLRAWLDVNNSIYLKIFTDTTCKTGRAILRVYPSPWDIVDKDIDEVKEELKKDERNKGVAYRLVNEYLVLAKELYKDTIKINNGDREEIKIYLYQYEMLENSLKEIDNAIRKLTRETIEAYDNITEIKGVGDSEINSLLAEIGLIDNFVNARALQSYFGLGIKGVGSGKETKPPKITKAGSKRARKMLYHMAMNLVSKNEDWRKVYCYYKSYNRNNANTKKEMLVAVACKFLRVIYGILKYNVEFDKEELFKGFDFKKCNKEKFILEYVGEKEKWSITEEEINELFR